VTRVRKHAGGRTDPFWAFSFISTMGSFLVLWLVMGWHPFVSWMLPVNAVALSLYGIDKAFSKMHGGRVPISLMFAIALLGGGFGALAGMFLFRHKTRKRSFLTVNVLSAAIWTAISLMALL